jgi:luciferase family oxidoreductase group 1
MSNNKISKLKVGLLDFGNTKIGKTSGDILNETFECVVAAEKAGYSRYWLTEHHNTFLAWGGPELLIGLLAGITERIRIGSAGILLSYYSPLKVAENFKLLATLFPGRIDMGIARGLGGDLQVAKAMLGQEVTGLPPLEVFAQKLNDLAGFLYKKFPEEHPYASIIIPPHGSAAVPDCWLLGSGSATVTLAASIGVSFGYSVFLNTATKNPQIIEEFRQAYNTTGIHPLPFANIAVAGACAFSEEEANRILTAFKNESVLPSVVGTPAQCREKILALSEMYGVDEIIFLDICTDHEDKLNSIRLLSEALGLTSDQ